MLFCDSAKFATVKRIRDEHVDNTAIQRSFSDICLAYQSQLKSKHDKEMNEKEREFRQVLQELRDAAEKEKMKLEEKARDQIRQREHQLEEQIRQLEEQLKQLEDQFRQLSTQAEVEATEKVDLQEKLEESEKTKEDLDKRLCNSEQSIPFQISYTAILNSHHILCVYRRC